MHSQCVVPPRGTCEPVRGPAEKAEPPDARRAR